LVLAVDVDFSLLPAPAQKALAADAPSPLRTMAARGFCRTETGRHRHGCRLLAVDPEQAISEIAPRDARDPGAHPGR
jgi:hypothetical protein